MITNSKKLSKLLKKRQIKGLLIDLDDTFLNTRELFTEMMEKFADEVASDIPSVAPEEVMDALKKLNNKSFDKFAVRRSRWKRNVDDMKVLFEDHDKVLDDAFHYLKKIYETPIELLPGALKVARTLSQIDGISLVLVTHAEEEWTYKKLAWAKLDKFFNSENIYIVDENVHKGPQHWRQAAEKFSLHPEEVLMVGDNLKGDIIAAHKAGIRHRVWIKIPGHWSKYSEGEVPEGTHEIGGINELFDKLFEVL